MQALHGYSRSLQGLSQPKKAKTFQVSHKTAKIVNAVYTLVFVQSFWSGLDRTLPPSFLVSVFSGFGLSAIVCLKS
jgi:hypothetical protein